MQPKGCTQEHCAHTVHIFSIIIFLHILSLPSALFSFKYINQIVCMHFQYLPSMLRVLLAPSFLI
jgi:hypothetical protein